MAKFFLFIIYSFLFLCIGGSAISFLLGVSPFAFFSFQTQEIYLNPFSDWVTLYKRFWYDNWVINSAEDLVIFFTFLLFFPLYFALWFGIRKVKWLKIIFSPLSFLNRTKVHSVRQDNSIKRHFDRPVALRQTKGFGNVNLPILDQNDTSVPQKDENVVLDREPPLGSDVLLEENKQSVSEELKSQIRNLGQQYGYDMFENVLLDGVNVPVVLATDSVALLLNPLTKKREWIADEDSVEEDIEPTWFSAEGLITSPFYQMCKAAEQLKQQEPESDIVPIVLLCEGSILNAGALIEQWHSKDAFVALLNNGKAEGLPHLEEVLALKNSSVSA